MKWPLALAVGIFLSGIAYGKAPPRVTQAVPSIPPTEDFHCITDAKAVIAKFGLAAANDASTELQMFTGVKATAILKVINDDPPPTHYKADALFVVLHHGVKGEEDEGAALTFLISDECVTGVLPKIPLGAWAHVISRSIGDDL